MTFPGWMDYKPRLGGRTSATLLLSGECQFEYECARKERRLVQFRPTVTSGPTITGDLTLPSHGTTRAAFQRQETCLQTSSEAGSRTNCQPPRSFFEIHCPVPSVWPSSSKAAKISSTARRAGKYRDRSAK
jgi:hypothetical protein